MLWWGRAHPQYQPSLQRRSGRGVCGLECVAPPSDKQITSIEQWVCSYTSVVAIRAPHRVRDLLAYMAMIVKAAHDFEGTPWLSYDAHFRCPATSVMVQAIWSQYFNRAAPKRQGSNPLSVGPYGDYPGQRQVDEKKPAANWELSGPLHTLDSHQYVCGGIRNRAERLTIPTGTYVWSATGNIRSSTAPCLVNPSNGPFGRMLASEPAAAEGVNPENWQKIHTPPTLQSYTISGLNNTSSSQHAPMIQSSPSIQSETSFSLVVQVITKSFDSKHTSM